MGARSKRAEVTRTADEFDLARLTRKLWMPRDGQTTIDAWSLEEIHYARTEQMIGEFVRPSRLVEMMRTDDALAVAWENRLAPQRCIPVEVKAARGARGASIACEAEAAYGANGVCIPAGVLADVHDCLVNHGVAFGTLDATPRDDGSRIDLELHYWPIEYVRWDPVFRVFKARADPNSVQPGDLHLADSPDSWNQYGFVGGYWIPVVHGDGRWVIFKKHDQLPFRKEAALLPAALIWARHAFAGRDWSRGSKSHGSAKMIGELPQGIPLQKEGGGLTAEAQAFIELMKDIAREDSPVGIRPSGAKTEFITNTSTAWQVWSTLMANAEKSAARIYLGTDGTLGSAGGAPGVDITELFGVAKTKVRGDLEAISRGINTGVIAPWCAMNFGDSRLAPKREYVLPNDEQEETDTNYAKRNAAFYAALVAAKEAGVTLTADYIVKLAGDYRVRVPAMSAIDGTPIVSTPNAAKAPSVALAPTDIARVCRVNEARSSAGLPPLLLPDGITPDPDGLLTVEAFAAKHAAKAASPTP